MLLARLNDIKKSENEIVEEFNAKFERLLQQIPKSCHPRGDYLLFLYAKEFPGQVGFMLKDKSPRTIQESQENVIRIEANLSSSKVKPFYTPRYKVDVKPKVIHNVETTQDISFSLTKVQEIVERMVKIQASIYRQNNNNLIGLLSRDNLKNLVKCTSL
jgi:hypothetical protein